MIPRYEDGENSNVADSDMSTHPSLRNMVSNLGRLAHVVPRNYKCPLKI